MRVAKAGILLGGLALASAAYLLIRPRILALAPGLAWIEFPIAILVVAVTLIFALRAPRIERATGRVEWRRHAQTVRVLPDAELARIEDALSLWLERGAEPERAAEILARVTHASLDDARALVAAAKNRRERLRLLNTATQSTRT